MDLLRWMGRTFARFVAVSVALISGWTFAVNVTQPDAWEPWVYAWIIVSGLVGAAGGILYLLSFDGPARFQTRLFRIGGWALMLLAVLLPTSLTFMLVPLVLVLIPTLVRIDQNREGKEEPVTSG